MANTLGVSSILFCPADDVLKLQKLPGRRIASVALDLEDAVALERRELARQLIIDHAPQIKQSSTLYVRINAIGSKDHMPDLKAAVMAGAHGVIVPKVESCSEVVQFFHSLDSVGAAPLRVIVMIETALGLLNMREIAFAESDRVETLMLGTADLCMELGISLSSDERELDTARSSIVAVARAAGLAAPLDGPDLDLGMSAFQASCERSRRRGFSGRVCLTPAQAHAAESAYEQATAEEVSFSKSVVEAFRSAQSNGASVTKVNDMFIDPPVYRRALQILERQNSDANSEETNVRS
ncbi:HpcH/HpaI aldolase/citrate lyase family protein [Arthrobacter sp. SD76]|uniref:HpcH/HpaI aldolase/citrate lyase family protein n=1 Tax=Arthrobacter sp. SD76 TaxID=3415007 RepID=UPI003C7881ED